MKPDATAVILAALAELQVEVRALRTELAMRRQEKTARQIRYERRCARLRELADAVGPVSWDTAGEVAMILSYANKPPKGLERITQLLLQDDECPTSQGRIWAAIRSDDELASLSSDGVSGKT